MALKTFNPTSPSRRHLVQVDRSALHKGRPEKSLTEGLTKKGGRNNTGRITMRRQGGGHKRLYRCLLYTSPSPRDKRQSRMPSSA